MVAIPIDVEDLAADKRASLAAHHVMLLIHDLRERGAQMDQAALDGWYKRWHHAIMRVAEHGPNHEGTTLIVNGTDSVDGAAAGIAVTSRILDD